MSIKLHYTFIVECDNCLATLSTETDPNVHEHTDLLAFPTTVAAINRALKQGWTHLPTAVLCPSCTQTTGPTPTQTPAGAAAVAPGMPGPAAAS